MSAAGCVEVATEPVEPAADWMDVRVLEARGHNPVVQLDDARPRPDLLADLPFAANGHDLAGPDGDRARPRADRVDGVDDAPGQDQVGGPGSGHYHPAVTAGAPARTALMFRRT